jgi:lipopolysaccharide transport system permease protein
MPASSETEPASLTPPRVDRVTLNPRLTTMAPSADVAWPGLVWTLVRTDFKARYHGTASGFVWALLKPATMFLVLVAVFSLVFARDPTYKLDLIIGLFLWDFFADATKTGMMSLSAKSFLLTKAKLPRWIVVVTSMANAVLTVVVFAVVVAIFIMGSGRSPGLLAFAAFATYLLALTLMVVGLSLASSVLFLRYRDLNQVWDMATQAGFFVAPIIYPLGVIPERFHLWLYLWPPTPVMEFARAALVDGTLPTARGHMCLAIMVGVLLAGGAAIYRRYAPRAAEYL